MRWAEFCPQNNPSSKTFFAETVQVACDGSNINPVALNVLNAKLANGSYYIPTPQTILPSGLGFSSFTDPAHFTEDQYLVNTDYVISQKHTLPGCQCCWVHRCRRPRAATAANKTLTCLGKRCMLWGINGLSVENGVVAVMTLQLANSASSEVVLQLTDT